jgi:P27 family predicted phage terminase small subunit
VSDSPSRPSPPTELGTAGKRLWKRIVADVDEALELDERDLSILEAACDQADSIRELRLSVKRDGRVIVGPKGPRLNGVVPEIRQAQQAQARLLALIDMDLTSASQSGSSRRARDAARKRWASAGQQSRRGEAA